MAEREAALPIAGRSMELDLRSLRRADATDGEAGSLVTCEIVFTAGARVQRYDWYRERYFLEELVVEDGAIRLGRLQRGAPLLNSHWSHDLESQLGVVESPAIRNGKGTVKATFSRRPSVAGYVQDVADGVIRSVSVGYVRHRMEMVPPEQEGGMWVYRVTDWEPMEVSLVPIPADMDSQVVRSAEGQLQLPDGRELPSFPCEFIEAGPASGQPPSSLAGSVSARSFEGASEMPQQQQQQQQQPQTRDEITALCTRHGLAHMASDMIERGVSVDTARSEIMELLYRRDLAAGGHRNVAGFDRNPDATRERDLIANTFAARMGARVEGETIRGASVLDLAIRALQLSGQRVSHQDSRDKIIRAALHTTGDFPNLLGSAVGRVLHQGYSEAPSALKAIARKANLPDFRNKTAVRLGAASELLRVNEHGEVKYGTVQDAGNTWALATYARIIGITRQALVNDDLDGFSQLLMKFGQAAARLEAEQLVTALTAPPQVDSADIFSTDRKSLLSGGGSALSADTLKTAVMNLRQQRELGNVLVQQEPGILVVPSALEHTARQLMAQFNPVQAGEVQPYRLDVAVEPRLDAVSTTAWYLVAKGQASLEYGYLDGEEGVQSDQRIGFEIEGVELKARLDFGCGWVNYIGWVKNTGA